jgi:hypothetical protein
VTVGQRDDRADSCSRDREVEVSVDRGCDVRRDRRSRCRRVHADRDELAAEIERDRTGAGRGTGDGDRSLRGDAGDVVGEDADPERGGLVVREPADRALMKVRAATRERDHVFDRRHLDERSAAPVPAAVFWPIKTALKTRIEGPC